MTKTAATATTTTGSEPANPNITREGIEVKPGQKWMDLDSRMRGRIVTVVSVEDGKAHVVTSTSKTRLSVRRMHKHSTGFKLVSE